MTNTDRFSTAPALPKADTIGSAARSLAARRTDFVMPDRKADASRNHQRGARRRPSRATRTIL